ncbi:hypothetical protein [Pseudomonas sp. WS 5079]|uniref:hypothetical protein n=1 Tax=Pseudomonas sp. WS 5079 TaxID=2717492 RepID=UPI00155363DD|nr:hypothetical protein [Pseudomonas sp. WS 5079]NMX60199.1 hypothetical protein [Pseudomonas sp. WS 5079]
MKLTEYLYTGPQSGASLRVDGELLDVQLQPGKPVELPADHEYTQVLLELKLLVPSAKKVAVETAPVELPAPEPVVAPTTEGKKGGKG